MGMVTEERVMVTGERKNMTFNQYVESIFPNAKGRGNERIVLCPFCGETKGHLYINVAKGAIHCFRCGYSAYAPIFIEDLKFLGYSVDFPVTELSLPKEEKAPGELRLPLDYRRLDEKNCKSWFADRVRSYLYGRGITDELITRHCIGYSLQGKYAARCIIPFYERGKLVYFVARSIVNAKVKILNPPAKFAKKSEVLFNIDFARQHKRVVICEGVFDAMSVGENAVCLLGKTISYVQLMKLLSIPAEEFVVMLDADAYKDAIEVAKRINEFDRKVRIAVLESGDPNENSKKDIQKAITEAKEFSFLTAANFIWGGNR